MLRDFGEVSVRYQDGTEEVVHFFASFEVLALNGSDAGRLRAGRSAGAGRRSRRGLRRHSLVVVFDRPRTVAVKRGTKVEGCKRSPNASPITFCFTRRPGAGTDRSCLRRGGRASD